jgi:signal transduction histidine kinase
VREITEFGEYNNNLLAQATLNSVRSTTMAFLSQNRDLKREDIPSIVIPPRLQRALSALHSANSVMRVNIYNQRGWIIYSSEPELVGIDDSADAHVQAALAGHISSDIHYRDAFNIFDQKTRIDNQLEGYVPIAFGAGDSVLGVFEIYVDIGSRVASVERAQWRIVGVALGVMGVLYLVLLAVVHLAKNVIERQQNEISAHASTLELLSARMLQHQENEKKRIAFDLQEGIAQTLAAVKMRVEAAVCQLSVQGTASPSAIEPMVNVMKEAIAEVRSFALNLRPSSFDELGLTATVQWFCREYALLHPEFQVELRVLLTDAQIPDPLRIGIFRVIEEICRGVSSMTPIRHISLLLEMDDDQIALVVEHDWNTEPALTAADDTGLAVAMERVVLSGGQFVLAIKPQGGRTVRVTWPTECLL